MSNYIDIRKRYLDLEGKIRDYDFSSGKFDDILSEQLDLLQDLQGIVYAKTLEAPELRELGNLTNSVALLFREKMNVKKKEVVPEIDPVPEKAKKAKK